MIQSPTIDTEGMVKAQEAIEAEWPDCTVSVGATVWKCHYDNGHVARRVDYHGCVQTGMAVVAHASARTSAGGMLEALRLDAATRKARADEEAAHTAEQAQSEP